MTDDNNARYRSNDPFARTPGPDGQGSDPLAELARLIGHSDPFSDVGRDPRVAAPREPQHYDDPAPPAEPPYEDRAGDRVSYDSRYDPSYSPEPASYFPDPAPQSHSSAPEWHHPPAPSLDPFPPGAHQPPAASPSADRGYADYGYQEPPGQPRAFHPDFSIPAPQPHHAGYDAPSLGAGARHGQGGLQPPLFSFERASPPPMDELYDDAPQGGRRKGLLTVVAVLCLAVVGTAGAFGYRTWFGGPSVKAPPAVIRASVEPSKVAPPPSTDPSANKISYDRFGDRGQNEKVVVREEKPIDLRDATRSGPASAMVPGTPSQSSPAVASATGNPPSVLTEPKRVRTVPIRPDTPDASAARPQMVAPPAASASAPVRQATVVAAAPSNAPLDLANPASPPAQVRASAPRPAPAPASAPMAAAPSANSPLSLAPESGSPPSAAPARSAPARVASAPAGNGSYLVQVASQRSEADAQAAYRSIQSKYSSVIGTRQPVIKRAELVGKGTYFRAMVGPFTTRDQAIQLCSSLKSAGGDCVVQAN
jgi:sporulation related protein